MEPYIHKTWGFMAKSRLHFPMTLSHERRKPHIIIFIALALSVTLLWSLFSKHLVAVQKLNSNPQNNKASRITIHPTRNLDITEFVRVQNGKFVVGPNCSSFYISGWNQWETMEAAAGALRLFGASLPEDTTGPALVREMMDKAVDVGMNVLRTWAHPVSEQYALMSAPGEYNEAVFRGLDYLLDEARKRGIRVLLALTDNWQPTGGADQFVTWAGGQVHEDFFTDEAMKSMYKDHVAVLLNRVNTINGRVYKEDPTIFGFDLINEPRCFQCGNGLNQWIAEMSAYVKSIDSQHLITVGEEGFYPESASQADTNPQGNTSWAFWEGQHFYADHIYPSIDFAAMHLWVQNWEDATEDFAARWIQQHIADAKALNKPLLLEEFGAWGGEKYQDTRDSYYYLIYSMLEADARAGGPSQGALFWQWYAPRQRAPLEEGGGPGGMFGVFESDSTWGLVQSFTRSMQELSGRVINGNSSPSINKQQRHSHRYTATTASTASAQEPGQGQCAAVPTNNSSRNQQKTIVKVKDCSYTWVRGNSGTGYEGPTCDLDINECVRGTAGCDANAACFNNLGSFTCTCHQGYSGNGFICTSTAELKAVEQKYVTLGRGKVACSEGVDVVFPPSAPGFAYDALGALEKHTQANQQGGMGSRVHVTPLQCMLACDQAPECDSFTYSVEGQSCFLKSGGAKKVCQKPETVCVSTRGGTYSCGSWQSYWKADRNELVEEVPGTSKLALALARKAGGHGKAAAVPATPP